MDSLILSAVDWAALAQQWIKMKESVPPAAVPAVAVAPPLPPVESKPDVNSKDKGEAPMDMDTDDKEPGKLNYPYFVENQA